MPYSWRSLVNCYCQKPPVSPLAENNIQSYSTIEGLTKKVAKLENEIKINQKEHEQNLVALRTQLVGHSEKFEILQIDNVPGLENFEQELTTLETQLQERAKSTIKTREIIVKNNHVNRQKAGRKNNST